MDKVYNIKTESIAYLCGVHESGNGKLKPVLFDTKTGEWDTDAWLSDVVPYDYYKDKIEKLARSRLKFKVGSLFSSEKVICSDGTVHDYYYDALQHEIRIIEPGTVFRHE